MSSLFSRLFASGRESLEDEPLLRCWERPLYWLWVSSLLGLLLVVLAGRTLKMSRAARALSRLARSSSPRSSLKP